jgi:putative ABC transport system permease protein
MLNDLHYALRGLLKKPLFAALTIVTLALGIGANAAIFSVVNGVLLRSLPYPEPDRLMRVWTYNPRQGFDKDVAPYPNFADWRSQSRSFEQLAAFAGASFSLTGAGDPAQLRGATVTPSFFPALNVQPLLGRWINEQDATPGHEQVVVLEHGLWERRFGRDRAIVGRSVQLNGQPYEVIGVMPPAFDYPENAAFWVPLAPVGQAGAYMRSRTAFWLDVIGRLRSDVTQAAAQAEMDTIARRLEQQYPDANAGQGIRLTSLHEETVGDVRRGLLILLGAVGCVLLIACANVANLLLTRATGRQKELAIRVALGAPRRRLLGQVLTESVVLALAGGVAGLFLAAWGVAALQSSAPTNIPRLSDIVIDARVFAFTFAVALVTGLIFGLVPAWHSASATQADALKEGGRAGSEGARGRRVRHVLAVVEVAIALVLLIGAALLVRSFAAIARTDLGIDPRNVLVLTIELPRQKYTEGARVAQFFEQLSERLAALPGVRSVGVGSSILLSRLPQSSTISIEGRPVSRDDVNIPVPYDTVTNGYFATLSIPLSRGRFFSAEDTPTAPGRVLVNESFVHRFFPGADPIDKRVTFDNPQNKDAQWLTIVGVVADTRRGGVDRAPWAELYFNLQQSPDRRLNVLVRTAGDPRALARAAQEQVWRLDPGQPVTSVRTVEELVARGQANRRFTMAMLGAFALVALALAAVGIYGVIAYSTQQRTQEIGIRVALGATRGTVMRMVLSDALKIGAMGVAIGIAIAAALTRLLAGLLFGVSAHDPLTFAVVPIVLLAIAVLASWIPARRALAVDPMIALRAE